MTQTSSIVSHPRPRNSGGVFILVLIGVVGLWAAVQIIQSSHSYFTHGSDAERTYNCLEQNGVWKVYLERGTKMYHSLCQHSFGTIYDLIAEKISENLFREHLAYAPQAEQGGTGEHIQHWLLRKGAEPAAPPVGPIEFVPPS